MVDNTDTSTGENVSNTPETEQKSVNDLKDAAVLNFLSGREAVGKEQMAAAEVNQSIEAFWSGSVGKILSFLSGKDAGKVDVQEIKDQTFQEYLKRQNSPKVPQQQISPDKKTENTLGQNANKVSPKEEKKENNFVRSFLNFFGKGK